MCAVTYGVRAVHEHVRHALGKLVRLRERGLVPDGLGVEHHQVRHQARFDPPAVVETQVDPLGRRGVRPLGERRGGRDSYRIRILTDDGKVETKDIPLRRAMNAVPSSR